MSKVLETERLISRELTLDDSPFIIELLNTPGWLRFIGDRNVETIGHAQNYLQYGPMKSYEQNGFGLYMVAAKSNNTPLGMCGVIKRDTLEYPDIGFTFLRQFAQQGFGFEAAKAILTLAQESLHLSTILAITDLDNEAFIKLLKKIGLRYSKGFRLPNEFTTLLLFTT